MRVLEVLVTGCALLASALIPFIMIGISLNVVGRYLFSSPIGWVFEFTEHALLSIPFLAMAWLVRFSNGHVRIDVVLVSLPPVPRRWLSIGTAIVAAGICAFSAWWAAATAWDNWSRNVMTIGLYPVPKGPLILVIAIGFALTSIEFARLAFRIVTRSELPDRDELDIFG